LADTTVMRRRCLVTLVALIMVVAGRPAGAESSAARESAVFEQLTRTDWCDGGCSEKSGGMPPTCYKVRFLRSGTLRRWAFSDYLENDRTEPWNFVLESPSAGRIRFGGAAALRFELRGDRLVLGGRTLSRCERPATIVDDAARARRGLPAMPEPAVLRALCAHDWVRLDDFDPDGAADRWHFDSTLACNFQFRGGACRQSGRFSIDDGLLLLDAPGQKCDGRDFHPYDARSPRLEVRNDTLVIDGHLHVDPKVENGVRLAIFPSVPRGVRLQLQYDGPFRAGVPKRLNLRFVCESYDRDNAPYRLRAFRASMQKYRPVDGGMGYDGPRVSLAERAYADRPLALGESFADTVTIVPPRKGEEVELALEWDHLDSRGVQTGRGRGLLPVR